MCLGGVSIGFAVVVIVLANLYASSDMPLRVALIGMAIGMAGLGFQFFTMAKS
jgi:hypothetical protein